MKWKWYLRSNKYDIWERGMTTKFPRYICIPGMGKFSDCYYFAEHITFKRDDMVWTVFISIYDCTHISCITIFSYNVIYLNISFHFCLSKSRVGSNSLSMNNVYGQKCFPAVGILPVSTAPWVFEPIRCLPKQISIMAV